jgi:hypothetical protein
MSYDITQIAIVCHEVNRAYCKSLGDDSQVPWNDAPDWQRRSCIDGVSEKIKKNLTTKQMHENWVKFKKEDGWVFGHVKDAEKKTHPCMVPYEKLPQEQQLKGTIFNAIVDAMNKNISE